MLSTRYSQNIPFYLFIATICSFLVSLFFFQVFAALLIFLWIFEKNKSKLKAMDKITYLFSVFIFIRILSALFSEFPEASSEMFYKDAIFILGLFTFTYYLKVFDSEKIRVISFAFVIAAAAVALIGLARFIASDVHRAASFTSGYMAFSLYQLAALSFGMMLYPLIKTVKRNIFYSSGVSLLLAGIITSLSRTNVIVAVVIFFTGIFILRISRLYTLGIVVVTALVCWGAFNLNTEELTRRIDTPATMSDRDILLQNAKELFLEFEHPFLGYGPRTFNNVFSKRDLLVDKGVGSWHNDYIQIYMESGFLGLLSYLALIGFVLLTGINFLRKKKPSPDSKALVGGSMLAIAALMIAALTSGFINSPQIAVLLAFFISAVSAFAFPVKPE